MRRQPSALSGKPKDPQDKPAGFFARLTLTTVIYAPPLSANARQSSWAWFDVCFVALLVLVLLVSRMVVIHSPVEIERILFHYTLGLHYGLYNISMLWLAMGKTRITLRVVPMLGCIALVLGLLGCFLHPYKRATWLPVTLTLGRAIGLAVIYCVMRWFGWHVHRIGQEPDAGEGSRAIPMRDLFMLTTCLAVMLAASRRLLPGVAFLVEFEPSIFWPIAVASITAISVLTLSPSRLAEKTSYAFAILLLVVLTAIPVLDFVAGQPFFSFAQFVQVELRIIVAGTLSTFVFLLAYRLRGWRLTLSAL